MVNNRTVIGRKSGEACLGVIKAWNPHNHTVNTKLCYYTVYLLCQQDVLYVSKISAAVQFLVCVFLLANCLLGLREEKGLREKNSLQYVLQCVYTNSFNALLHYLL